MNVGAFLRIRLFSGRFSRGISLFLAVLMVVLVPLDQAIASSQLRPQKTATGAVQRGSVSRPFTLTGTGRETVEFEVKTAGRIEARAEWTGPSRSLAVILNGPGKTQFYARKDGSSPLVLSFDVTAEILVLGSGWRISVASFDGQTNVRGTLTVKFPGAAQAPTSAGGAAAAAATAEKAAAGTERARQAGAKTVSSTKLAQQKPAGTAQKTATSQVLLTGRPALDENELLRVEEERIRAAVQRDPAARILIPVMLHQIETIWPLAPAGAAGTASSTRRLSSAASPVTAAAAASRVQRGQLSEAARARIDRSTSVVRGLSAEFRRANFHPRYADLRPGRALDNRRIALDLLDVVRPGYESELRKAVELSVSRIARRGSLAVPAGGARQIEVARAPARKPLPLSGPVREKLSGSLDALSSSRTEAERKDLEDSLAAELQRQGYSVGGNLARNPVSASIVEGVIGPHRGDLNDYRRALNDYRYQVRLDSLRCVYKDERSDEPYLLLRTTVPQFDPSDDMFSKYLADGCLNRVNSWVTPSVSGVGSGSVRAFSDQSQWVLDTLTYASPTTLSFDLWEEDNGKIEVADAAEAIALEVAWRIRYELEKNIKAALLALMAQLTAKAIAETIPGASAAVSFLESIAGGHMTAESFAAGVRTIASGQFIDPMWIIFYYLMYGGNIDGFLSLVGFGSPMVGIVILATAVLLPALFKVGQRMIDNFISGDIKGGLVDFVLLLTGIGMVWEVLKSLWNSVKDLIHLLAVLIDPDDCLGSQTVTIKSSDDPLPTQDAVVAGPSGTDELAWWGRNADTFSRSAAAALNRQGYGPTDGNNNLKLRNGDFIVPKLRFKQPDLKLYTPDGEKIFKGADYILSYNVRRDPWAAREYYGYSLKGDGESGNGFVAQHRTRQYVARGKSEGDPGFENRIRVWIVSDTAEAPFVILEGAGGSWWNEPGGRNPFSFEARGAHFKPGDVFQLSVFKCAKGDMSGQIIVIEAPEVDRGAIFCAPIPEWAAQGSLAGAGRRPIRVHER